MQTREQERERLLGYLLHALDEHEAAQVKRELSRQPHLRSELATIQQELAPLNYIADPACPPPQLANRTCANIWEMMDKENCFDKEDHLDKDNDNPVTDNPATMDSVLGFIADPFKTIVAMPVSDLELPKIKREARMTPVKTPPNKPSKSSHWVGLIVSASIGIVAACFVFPMIRYAERSTRSYVTDSWMTEINRRVDQYEQIYSGPSNAPRAPSMEELRPLNLALYNWQELHSDARGEPVLFFAHHPRVQDSDGVVRGQQPILLMGFDHGNEPMPLETSGYSSPTLLSLPGQESLVRTALGQDILIRDGRVFFRILPGTESPNK